MDFNRFKNQINEVCQTEGIEFMGVFGSTARGEETEDSDIDIIIKYKTSDKTLFDLVRLENKLTELFGKKVDLLTDNSISPYIVDELKRDLKVLYS